MEDEAILLKLKREFTTNEAVQSLLKIVSQLELEIGRLKSELSEEKYISEKLRKKETMTKKQWLQEEVFKDVARELELLRSKYILSKKSLEYWRQKYFSLSASLNQIDNEQ